jgi:hypothetical protein
MNRDIKTVPKQRKGARSATTYSVMASDTSSAISFLKSRRNLLNVNRWHTPAGPSSAVFQMVNNTGEEQNICVKKGNYLRITLPVLPGS